MVTEIWPPAYDADELKEVISKLINSDKIEEEFYGEKVGGVPFQGDIIKLDSDLPLIWEDCKPATNGNFILWLVIGNTCDIYRPLADVSVTQIIPIVSIPKSDVDQSKLNSFKSYAYSRRFYLPQWDDELSEVIHFADFLRPVTIHKNALSNCVNIEATLKLHSWLLLNSCMVRFLARDDRRFE